MFIDSSKIVLVESSVTGKETGPRKGSLGYIVSNCVDPFVANINLIQSLYTPKKVMGNVEAELSPYINNIYYNNILYYFQPAEITFTRFGFEKNSRVEHKNVISVFPILSDTNEKIEHNKFLNKEVIRKIRNIYNSDWSTPVVIAAPSLMEKKYNFYSNTDNKEFDGWATSILKNNLLKLILSIMPSDIDKTNFKNNSLLTLLFNNKNKVKLNKEIGSVIHDKKEASAFVRTIIPQIEDLKKIYVIQDLIEVLREINSILITTTIIYHSRWHMNDDRKYINTVWRAQMKIVTSDFQSKIAKMQQHLIQMCRKYNK